MRKSNAGRNIIIIALFSMVAYGLYVITKNKEAQESIKNDCDDIRCRLSDIRNRIDLLSRKANANYATAKVKKQELYLNDAELEDEEKLLDDAELE